MTDKELFNSPAFPQQNAMCSEGMTKLEYVATHIDASQELIPINASIEDRIKTRIKIAKELLRQCNQ